MPLITDNNFPNDSNGKLSEGLIAIRGNFAAIQSVSKPSATAGCYGSGFAVVANEVKNLAEKTAIVSKNISIVISNIKDNVKQSVEFSQIGQEVTEKGKEIAKDSITTFEAMYKNVERITKRLLNTADTINNYSSSSDQILHSTNELKSLSENILKEIDRFSNSIKDISIVFEEIQNISYKSSIVAESIDKVATSLIEVTKEYN